MKNKPHRFSQTNVFVSILEKSQKTSDMFSDKYIHNNLKYIYIYIIILEKSLTNLRNFLVENMIII